MRLGCSLLVQCHCCRLSLGHASVMLHLHLLRIRATGCRPSCGQNPWPACQGPDSGPAVISCTALAVGLPGGTTFARDVPEHGPTIHQLRCRHTRRLVRMSGTVTRTGAVCMVEAQRTLQCTKCKFRFLISADQEDGFLPPTEGCPSVSSTGKPCEGTSFKWDEAMLHTNFQGRSDAGIVLAPCRLASRHTMRSCEQLTCASKGPTSSCREMFGMVHCAGQLACMQVSSVHLCQLGPTDCRGQGSGVGAVFEYGRPAQQRGCPLARRARRPLQSWRCGHRRTARCCRAHALLRCSPTLLLHNCS